MNSRGKFLSTINFETISSVPDWEFAYWYDTIQRWYAEGMPKRHELLKYDLCQFVPAEACPAADHFSSEDYYSKDARSFFEMDERVHIAAFNNNPFPLFEREVYDEDEENIVLRAFDGKIIKTKRDGSSMPQYLEYPVKSREDFEIVKARFDACVPERFPADWESYVKNYSNRTYPLQLGGGAFSGFYSILRELMGLEHSLYTFYDDPEFITEILDYFFKYYITLYSKVLSCTDVDYILIWEDLSFKNGPLISPSIFREFIYPYYCKFINTMKELGVKHFFVDTDGNFEALLPMFVKAGVTGFYPFEAAAEMDVLKIREQYPKLVIMGAVDKRSLAGTKEQIDQELRKVNLLIGKGGYIPYTDHMVPPEVSLENYSYFRQKLKEIIKSAR